MVQRPEEVEGLCERVGEGKDVSVIEVEASCIKTGLQRSSCYLIIKEVRGSVFKPKTTMYRLDPGWLKDGHQACSSQTPPRPPPLHRGPQELPE